MAAALLCGVRLAGAQPSPGGVRLVHIETDAGRITAEIDSARAPVSAANFLRYVREGRYDGGVFYRAVTPDNQPGDSLRIEVIQGGLSGGAKRLPPIPHETTAQTGLRHVDGALSLARARPGSASSEFFITIGAQPALDHGGMRNPDGQGFAVFGRVVDGMDVVRRIQRQPTRATSRQYLEHPVRIQRVRLVDG